MWNPIEWILFIVEVVDFLDEEMAGWAKNKLARGSKWNQKSRDTHTNSVTSTHGFTKEKSSAQLRRYGRGNQPNGGQWSTLG
jgi:hypothetical protein